MKKGLILCLMVLLSPLFVGAQTANNTSLVGTVTDANGGVIAGAHVTAVNRDTKVPFDVITNPEGYYTITGGINPGTYDISVEVQGFQKELRTGATVVINEATRTDFHLKPGSTSTEVTISANTPAIQTDDALLGETVDEKMVEDLPLNGRNALDLAATASNIIVTGSALSGTPPGENVAGAGTRGINNDVTLDGITIMNDLIVTTTVTASPDSLGAVQTQTGNFTAQIGSYLGVHVNESSKSGTNKFHGTAFEYLQNDAFNSLGYNHSATLPTKTHFRYDVFGGVIDGPIIIPGLFNGKDKLFFMGSYQGLRQKSIPSSLGSAYTPALLGGDFSVYLNPAYNGTASTSTGSQKVTLLYSPFDGHPYYNAGYTSQVINDQPASAKTIVNNILAYAPRANLLNAGDTTGNATLITQNFRTPVLSTTSYNQSNDRVDFNPNEKMRFFGRYIFQKANVLGGSSAPVNETVSPTNSRNGTVGYTQIITPNLVNDFRVGFNWLTTNTLDYQYVNGIANADTALGIPGFNIGTPSGDPGIVDISAGIFSLSQAGENWFQDERTYQLYDQISWTKNKHSFSAGADIRKNVLSRASANSARGIISFSAGYTGVQSAANAGTNPRPTCTSSAPCTLPNGAQVGALSLGLADASLYDGVASSSVTPITQVKIEAIQWRDGFFVQDQWQLAKKLTLQYGVRYDLPLVPYSGNGNGRTLDPTLSFLVPTAPAGCAFAACAVGTEGNFHFHGPEHNDIAPRLGFTFRPADKIVFRGGAGIYYSEIQMNAYTLMNNNYPFANSQSYNSIAAGTSQFANQNQFVTLQAPAPGAQAGTLIVPGPGGTGCTAGGSGSCASSVFTPQYYMQSEAEYQWNLDNGIELWKNAGLELQYLGSHSVHLNFSDYPNTPPPPNAAPGTTVPTVNLRRPDLNWGVKRQLADEATSMYNGLTTVFRQRLTHGLSLNASYTWSHSMDEVNNANNGGTPMWQEHLKLDWGPATTGDNRHNLVVSFTYALPTFSRSNFLVQEALGGWQVNGIETLTSAPYISITLGTDWANTGSAGTSRMNFAHVGNDHIGVGCTKKALQAAPYNTSIASCIDQTAYTLPTQYTYGNAHRGDLRGVNGSITSNLSLFKAFKIHEQTNFQFRIEGFNAFNHANMGNPGGSFTATATTTAPFYTLTPSSSFGQAGIGSAGRTVQISGRINF